MLQEIFFGVGVLTSIVLVLSLLIMLARSRLVPSGNVTIRVNDERDLSVPVGVKLLGALAANELFVPAACGGGGSCGQCRVTILEGGGAILPIETSHITKRKAAEGERLACQVGVNQDMNIRVPEVVFGIKRRACKVRSNDNVATFIKELVLELPPGESLDFRAGGYIQTECPPHRLRYADFDIPAKYRDDWERFGLFDLESVVSEPATRAYSMANYPAEADIVTLLPDS